MKSCSHLIPVILAISREIMLKFEHFLLKIMENHQNYFSWIQRFMQLMKSEIPFRLDSCKFCSQPITTFQLCCSFEPFISAFILCLLTGTIVSSMVGKWRNTISTLHSHIYVHAAATCYNY